MAVPRRRLVGAWCGSIIIAVIIVVAGPGSTPTVHGHPDLTVDTLFDWVTRYSNWGRWGAHDELGTDNFITPRLRVRAARLVRSGVAVPLARRPYKIAVNPFLPHDPNFPNLAPQATEPLAVDESQPFVFWANPPSYTSDRWNVRAAGATISHLDAMCHTALAASTVPRVYPDRYLYNRIPLSSNNTADGCAKLGIQNNDGGVFTRGVLFDATLLPELLEPGYPWVAPGTAITRAHLEELEWIQKVKVRSGDVVLLYTGRWARRDKLGPWPTRCIAGDAPPACGLAGFYADTIPFIYEREVSHMGHDSWIDVTPGGFDAFAILVYHGFDAALGMNHFDNLDLEALAAAAKKHGRYEFLFTTAPFPVEGGITSILNPIAIF